MVEVTDKLLKLHHTVNKRLDRCVQLSRNGKYDLIEDHLSTIIIELRSILVEVKKKSLTQRKERDEKY
mgnify:CR=1 FL=1